MTYVIGVVGGIASGKSSVAEELGLRGAAVLDADQAAHFALHRDHIKQALRDRWGERVFDSEGEIDRKAVAELVFVGTPESRSEKSFLEDLLHPQIRAEFAAAVMACRQRGIEAAVIDAPLLLEAGWGPLVDEVLMVDCEPETRLARALERGWAEEDFHRREASQMPIEEKEQAATAILDNNGSPEQLREAVRRYWEARVAPGTRNEDNRDN